MEQAPGLEMVGDSQEGQLEVLAAAMTSPPPEQPRAGQTGAQNAPEAETAAPPPLPAARGPAAAAFVAECRRQGTQAHPQLLDNLNRLEPEAYVQLTPQQRPGTGGAVLKLPPDAAPQHVEALLALACMRNVTASSPNNQAGSQVGEPSHYLRTVHLDLSGHALSQAQVQDLLLDAPWRLRHCMMLEGLVLAGCQLQPEALSLLESWRVMRIIGHLKRLVLADNAQLGRDPSAPEQCLGPLDTEWLEGRLLQAAGSLELLDMRRTGFGNQAYACLLYQLAHYSLTAPICAEHGGCRASLRCLKLGPPADQPHFGEDAAAQLQQVLRALPHLEAVEVEGLTPEAIGALLPAWQEALQQRGHEGCTIVGEGGALRFARMADGEGGVAAERLPNEHVPLQPLPPQHLDLDEQVMPLSTEGAAGEVQQALPIQRTQQHGQPHLVQQQLTTHLAGWTHTGSRQARQAQPRRQRPREPGHGLPRQPPEGSGGFGSLWDTGQYDGNVLQHARPAVARQGGGSGRAIGAGAPAGQPGARGAPRQRRRRQGGGSHDAAEGLYRGGRREDDLPDGGRDLLDSQGDYSQDDDYESEDLAPSDSEEDESGSEDIDIDPCRTVASRQTGTAAAAQPARNVGASGIEGDHFSHIPDDDKAGRLYERLLKDKLEELRRRSPREHATAKGLSKTWSMAEYSFDRRRWKNPPFNPDSEVTLNAFLRLNEVLERNGLNYPFPPMPAEKRQKVLAWREEQRAKEAMAQALVAQHAHKQAAAAPAGRPSKLRRVGELEQEALRDEMEDGSPPAATLGTQRQKRKQQQVLSDSDSGEEGSDGGSEDSRLLVVRVQHRAVLRTPAAQLPPDIQDSPPLERQQPKQQRPVQALSAGGNASEQQQSQQPLPTAAGQGSRPAALANGQSPQAAHAGAAAYRPSQLAAVAQAEAEAAVAAAVQQLRLVPDSTVTGAEPTAPATATAARTATGAAIMPGPMLGTDRGQQFAVEGSVIRVDANGELYVPDSEDED